LDPGSIFIVISLFIVTVLVCLIALLFRRKIRVIIWLVSLSIFILVFVFYAVVRPYIVKQQTTEAIENLDIYLEEKYPNDSWEINHPHEDLIKSEVVLHVIFESESEVVYEYIIKDNTIDQVDFWLKSGNSDYSDRDNLEHYEPDWVSLSRGTIENSKNA